MALRASLLAAFLLASASGPASAQSMTKVKFVLDWAWQSIHASWALAQDRGYFKDEGLDVTIDRGFGSGDTVAKVAAKAYDIGFADGSVLIKFNAENPGDALLNVAMLLDRSPSAVVFLKSSGITSPKDIEGKTVSSTKNDAISLMFPAFARINGIDASTVEWKYVEPRLRDVLVMRGQAEATLGWATSTAMNMMATGVKRDDIGFLLFHDYGMPLFSSGLLVRKDYAAKNPEAVRGFVRATFRGLMDMLSDTDAAVAAVQKRDSLLKTDIETVRLALFKDIAMVTPDVKKNGVSSVDRARFEKAASLVASAFNLKITPKMEDTYTDRFLPPKSERMIK